MDPDRSIKSIYKHTSIQVYTYRSFDLFYKSCFLNYFVIHFIRPMRTPTILIMINKILNILKFRLSSNSNYSYYSKVLAFMMVDDIKTGQQ